jgi:hypothetical protein
MYLQISKCLAHIKPIKKKLAIKPKNLIITGLNAIVFQESERLFLSPGKCISIISSVTAMAKTASLNK